MDFYIRAAQVLDGEDTRRGSIMSLARSQPDAKRLLAICFETRRYGNALSRVISNAQVFENAKILRAAHLGTRVSTNNLVHVLVHDMLFAKRGLALPKRHKVRVYLEKHAHRLHAEKEREKIRIGGRRNEDLCDSRQTPIASRATTYGAPGFDGHSHSDIRWLRVNELKWSIKEAHDWLCKAKWRRVNLLQDVLSADHCTYALDVDLPDLLAFPAKLLNLTAFAPYLDGRMIAQDKSSCMPARVLFGDGEHVSDMCQAVDATAAPGNKTSHLAALLQPYGGKILAFELHRSRYLTLKVMCEKAGCKNVETICGDFLAHSRHMSVLATATLLLVDPSCSGSGIISRVDSNVYDRRRLHSLSNFQAKILRAALNCPMAQRVVYSTCSLHEVENEGVICNVLAHEDVKSRWRVAQRSEALPGWSRRGITSACANDTDLAQGMIRCHPQEDRTNGFFVCLLLRSV